MIDEPVRVSLLISTCNRAAGLRRCLEAIGKITHDSWELIVVDNGSTDDTELAVNESRQFISAQLHYIYEARRGLAFGRNAGLAHAQGAIVAFTDDDCYPDPSYLTAIEDAFVRHPELGYLSGRIELFDEDDAPVTIKTSPIEEYIAPHSYIGSGKVVGANMAFRRDLVESVGEFDTRFGAGTSLPAGEEQDYAMRASLKGWRGKYCPEILIFHHHGRKTADVARLHANYDIGRGGYNTKLLFDPKTFGYGILGWAALAKRIVKKQTTAVNEIQGAVRYIKLARKTQPT